ncbi:MAG: hypothetical protein JW955_20185, partial [Sedimentisphaerales bacterium]|nr:hypothetical protein [Sedimentisphaerales bacterium]
MKKVVELEHNQDIKEGCLFPLVPAEGRATQVLWHAHFRHGEPRVAASSPQGLGMVGMGNC